MNKAKDVASQYTHEQYRKAGVARILNEKQQYEFYFLRKLITYKEANKITEIYLQGKSKLQK